MMGVLGRVTPIVLSTILGNPGVVIHWPMVLIPCCQSCLGNFGTKKLVRSR